MGLRLMVPFVMKKCILAYMDSNPPLLGVCAKPLTITVTYMIYGHNNFIISYYNIFRMF